MKIGTNFKIQMQPSGGSAGPANSKRGFSLIELAVVLGIFVIVITATINIFISVVKQQRKILEEQELLNQTSYAFEYMSKALRMAIEDFDGGCLGEVGRVYLLTHCDNDPNEPCGGVKFINSSDNDACQEFFFDELNINTPLMERKNVSSPQYLLSSKFKIEYGKFVINGNKTLRSASASDLIQPKVTFVLDILTQSNESEKVIQTTVSQGKVHDNPPPNPPPKSCNFFNQCVDNGGGIPCVTADDCSAPL